MAGLVRACLACRLCEMVTFRRFNVPVMQVSPLLKAHSEADMLIGTVREKLWHPSSTIMAISQSYQINID